MIFGLSLLYWGLWLAILILWMGRFVTSFLSIYLVSALRLDEGVVGTVVAMYGFGAIIGCLFGGTLSDRFGRQSMIIIGEIGAAAALLVVSVLTDPVSLGAALFVYGAFASLPSPAIAAYIADVVPAERQQRAYVLQSWAINFGYAIGPIVANQLVKISYSLMFYVEAAVMIAVTILLIAFFREVRHLGITVSVPSAVRHEDECSVTHAEFAGIERPNHSDAAPAASVKGAMSRNWRRVLTDTPFLGFSLLMFGYFLVYFQSTSGLPIAMTDLGLGLGEYSVLLTINGGMLCLPSFLEEASRPEMSPLIFYLILFLVCLGCVMRIYPWTVMLIVILLAVLFKDRTLFQRVDYFLLLTFVCFFVFIGNMERLPAVSSLLTKLIAGREFAAGVLLSQCISNVPAAILLSGFTDAVRPLLYGVNIGGLGTLIASLASVISYRAYAEVPEAKSGTYMVVFTAYNLVFLAVLCIAGWALMAQ